MAILTTTVSRTFTRTKKERTVSGAAASLLSNLQANSSSQNVGYGTISAPTYSNVNIVGSPQFTPLEYTDWEESPGSPADPDTVSDDKNPCLDKAGNEQHAGGPWHLTSSTTTDGTPNWTAGGGGTASVTYTYDSSWTLTPPLPSPPGPAGGIYNHVGVQATGGVPVDETQTPQTKVDVYTSYAGGVTCY